MASSKYSAALIGEPGMMVEVIDLLKRADFIIDVIPTRPYFFWQKLNNCSVAKDSSSLINQARAAVHNRYDLISILDDKTLRILHSSSLTEREKEVLLPVVSLDNSSHIGSKIELSRLLEKCGILTPSYFIANNLDELASGSERLGYPILVKIDASAGGLGVFECNGVNDLLRLQNKTKFDYPLLIQKKITGEEFDLSGFFQQGKLIHFSFSKVDVVVRKFGPASVRTYYQMNINHEPTVNELRAIGRKLGINGFANIACIVSKDDLVRYYFEIDLRPTLWVNYSKYIGSDPAMSIRNYFYDKSVYKSPVISNLDFSGSLTIPHRYRLSALDLLLNKFGVWKFMNKVDIPYLLIRNTYRGFRFFKNLIKKFAST